jgi:rfaE bifunctional protein nucleotidyltransferase chain/domain
MSNEKIVSVDKLVLLVNDLRENSKKIVLCHGTFDLMHIGHIKYLQSAKKRGDVLIATITADEFVNKGPGRPVFTEKLRAENLAALECVDYVAINYSLTAVELLEKVRPTFYVKGSEYRDHSTDITGNIVQEIEAVKAYGGEVFYTDEITFSSSSLLNEHFDVFSPKTKRFLNDFKSLHTYEKINNQIDFLKKNNVLIVGDTIIDQYHYVSLLGQTGKGEHVLAAKYLDEEQFAGGALAVANHVSKFVNSVDLLTCIGKKDGFEDFIIKNLNNNINPIINYFTEAPTVTKRRYLNVELSKFFEVYFYNENPEIEEGGKKLYQWLNSNLSKYDLVIAADFGNGFINEEVIKLMCSKSQFLAVNTQINSGNRGFHTINKYPRADFVCLNEPELRLATQDRNDQIENLCKKVAVNLNLKSMAVTRGRDGALFFDILNNLFYENPALSTKVVDRIGAGDAYLSLASLCAKARLKGEVTNFIASVAAAIEVQVVCNREPVNSIFLKKYITTLLK